MKQNRKVVPFIGSCTAIVTPFDRHGRINISLFGELIDFQIENDTDAIVVCGTTGESATLTDSEKEALFAFAVNRVDGKIPVIAGTGSNSTHHSIELSRRAERVGTDGLLLVTPYYNKTSQKGLIRHFNEIADSVDMPVILYNVPSRTGMTILPATCLELSKNENIVAIKEASGDISHIAETVDICGDDLYLYSGNDDQTLPMLALGALGVISVLSNIMPAESHCLCELWQKGEIEEARKLALRLTKINKAIFSDVNPIPIKTALRLMGYDVGQCRMPLCDMSEEGTLELKDCMKSYGLL